MSRRRRPEKRVILPDPKFGDLTLSKFMNSVMLDGKKSVAEGIVYTALESVEQRLKKDPLQVFHDALNNVKPGIEVRSRRVGASAVRPTRCRSRCASSAPRRWPSAG
jgi:small subunit ribosomal protein S7